MDRRTLSTPRIPYDVLISIIDALASEKRVEELRAFSQACHMLLHPCRAHLFSAVTITETPVNLQKRPSIYSTKILQYKKIIFGSLIMNLQF